MAKGRKTGGRRKGSLNKGNAELRDMIFIALDKAGGVDYLTSQATASPQAFIGLLGKTLPRDVKVDVGKTLEQLIREAAQKSA